MTTEADVPRCTTCGATLAVQWRNGCPKQETPEDCPIAKIARLAAQPNPEQPS